MKEKKTNLKLFNFSHPLINTEIMSLMGHKYIDVLPFDWEITPDYKSADILLWDGVITPKNRVIVEQMITDVKSGKILLLIGESMTLLKQHPVVKLLDTDQLNYVDLPGWSIIPEEVLSALENCYKKLKNV